MLATDTPYKVYFELDGTPLDRGFLYYGQPNQNPLTNPKTVYWDVAGTQPAAQPIRTLNGWPSRNGSPATVYVDGDYSIVVMDRRGKLVFYAPSSAGFSNDQMLSDRIDQILTNLILVNGAGLIGWSRSSTYSRSTVGRKLQERVSVDDFLTTDTPTPAQSRIAIQAAFDSGARYVYISGNYTVDAPLTLAANQTVDWDGGSIIATAAIDGTSAPNGILFGSTKAGVKLIDPVVDASATGGVTGIQLLDCTNGTIIDGKLTKCCLLLKGSANTVRQNFKVRGLTVDMAGWQSTAVFLSAVYKASLIEVECYNGIEGIGLYGACRHIKHSSSESWGHTRDGFVIIDAQRVTYSDCIAHGNTQSGFTTQRLTAGSQCQYVSYTGCQAYQNSVDGFDLRGANGSSYGVNMNVTLSSCISRANGATGYYIVLAEGTSLSGCVAEGNTTQGFLVDQSARTILAGCRSISNATGVVAGTAKAGILIQSSVNTGVVGCISDNSGGSTQMYGISYTGVCTASYLTGGEYLNNTTLPFRQDNPHTYVAGAALQDVANVYIDTITGITGVYSETGLGVPTHTRPKASMFRRLDSGGGGEMYISNGGGSWTLK